MRQLEHKNLLLQERARISRDLHDGLGTSLSHIRLFADMIQRHGPQAEQAEAKLRQLAVSSEQAARALKEIIWLNDPGQDTLRSVIDEICRVAEELLGTRMFAAGLKLAPFPMFPWHTSFARICCSRSEKRLRTF